MNAASRRVGRRSFLAGVSAFVAALTAPQIARPEQAHAANRIAELERRSGGRLGVCVLDAPGQYVLGYRASERFPICSTFKVLLVSLVLERVDTGTQHLEDHIHYGKSDLIAHAPVTSANVARGFMTIERLCQAAMEQSDNTAANLLLRAVGGPAAVTRFARSIGDAKTRLDRGEPALNTAIPGDPRDTTTPSAMAADLRTLLAGTALSRASRERLAGWMVACQTGIDAIRAAVPKSWRAGDKTGSGDNGTRNDVAFLRPPGQPTVFVTAYLTG